MNGMDVTDWSPDVDKYLDVTYDKDTIEEGKAVAKETLQAELGLDVRSHHCSPTLRERQPPASPHASHDLAQRIEPSQSVMLRDSGCTVSTARNPMQKLQLQLLVWRPFI